MAWRRGLQRANHLLGRKLFAPWSLYWLGYTPWRCSHWSMIFFLYFPTIITFVFLFLQLVEHVIFRTPKISALKGHHDMTLKGICLMCLAWRVNHVRCRRACGDAVCLIQQGRAHQFFVLVGWSNHLSVMVDTWDSILLRPMFLGNVSQVRDHLEFALIRLLEDSLKHYCTI
jgi:hypothetical protein